MTRALDTAYHALNKRYINRPVDFAYRYAPHAATTAGILTVIAAIWAYRQAGRGTDLGRLTS